MLLTKIFLDARDRPAVVVENAPDHRTRQRHAKNLVEVPDQAHRDGRGRS